MAAPSAQESSEWDDDPAWTRPDPMTAAELEAGLDRVCEHDEPPEEEEVGNFEPFTAEELAEIREAAADELLAVEAATTGRRGPGQPGSARVFPGRSSSPAAGCGPGMPLDVLPGCAALAVAADAAAGGDGGFAGVSEAELTGVVCAWDRVEAHAAARKLAAIAELARRNPAPDDAGFTADQVAYALAESRGRADTLLDLAQTLHTRLPGTMAALEDGTITRYKAEIIARPPRCSTRPRPAPPRTRSWTGPPGWPRRAALRDRSRAGRHGAPALPGAGQRGSAADPLRGNRGLARWRRGHRPTRPTTRSPTANRHRAENGA